MTGVQEIESKLEIGIQQFSAQEVVFLLNEIRIYQHLYYKEKEYSQYLEKENK